MLPGGTRLTAASFDQAAPYVRARVPDYGLDLDPRWQPPWDHGHICWPDFGLPTDADALTRTLRAADHTHRPADADYHYLASAIADVMGATREMQLAKRPGGGLRLLATLG